MSLLEFTRAIQGDKKFTIDAVNYTDSSREFNTEEAQDPEVESGLIPAGTYNGDWLEYTFDVSAEMADAYYLTMHVARAGTAPGDIQMEATPGRANRWSTMSRAGTRRLEGLGGDRPCGGPADRGDAHPACVLCQAV